MVMEQIILRTGALTSFKSLHYNLAPKLKLLREAYARGETPSVCWDLKEVGQRTTSMAALTAFLSIAKRIRDFIGNPIPVIMNWDPNVLAFWADTDFLGIANKFEVFQWPEGMLGGFSRGKTNPNTKILYFADVPKISLTTFDEINDYKAYLKQKISPNLLLRTASVLHNMDTKLKLTVSNTTLELVANSLIHGLDISFVGIQRTSSRITVSVCDTGIGFRRSLKKIFPNPEIKINNIQALIIGSLVQKKEHGLRLAINEVLNYSPFMNDITNQGWVMISSYESEIRWQKLNWDRAQKIYDSYNYDFFIPDENELLGNRLENNNGPDAGYWINYNDLLIGTRVSFEIYTKNR